MTMGFLAKAQTGKIKGFVYDKENGEPVLFTNVTIKGTTLGAATDVNGYYTVTNVPAGEQTVQITYLGYDTLSAPVTIEANQIASLNLFLCIC